MNTELCGVMVLFDLPVETKKWPENYTEFGKAWWKTDSPCFSLVPISRHCPSRENADVHVKRVKKNLPPKGHVGIPTITDKQFGMMQIFYRVEKEKPNPPQQLELFKESKALFDTTLLRGFDPEIVSGWFTALQSKISCQRSFVESKSINVGMENYQFVKIVLLKANHNCTFFVVFSCQRRLLKSKSQPYPFCRFWLIWLSKIVCWKQITNALALILFDVF